MISFLGDKLILWIYSRAIRGSRELVYVSIYKRLRSLGADTSRKEDIEKAADLTNLLVMPACFLALASNVSSNDQDKENVVLSCDDVRSALGCYFSVYWFFGTWLKSDEPYLRADYSEAALKVLDIENRPKSIRDILDLTKEAGGKVKTIRRELASNDLEEATDAVYSIWFPEPLSFNQLFSLLGILSSAYIAGSYIFTRVVFFSLDSKIVGLTKTDYLMFATNHCLSKVPMVVLGMLIAMTHQLAKAKIFYLSQDLDVKPKRFTSYDVLIWISLGIINIPLLQHIFGFQNNGWEQAIVFDIFWLILIAFRELPYERIVSSWFAVHIFLVTGMILMFFMLIEGWNFSEKLKEPSTKQWEYTFDNTSLSSVDFSLVFEGERSFVFYHRENEELEVMDSKAKKSFSGKL